MMGNTEPDPEKRHTTGKGKVSKYRHKYTELINGERARKYIDWHLEKMSEEDRCAMFMIDLDNMPEVNERLGYREEEHVEQCACQTLSALFKATDVVSRIGRDEFLVFVKGIFTEKDIERKAEQLCSMMHYEAGTDPVIQVTASVGVYLAEGGNFTFEKLFGQAAAALYEAKNNGRRSYHLLTNADEMRDRALRATSGAISVHTLLEYLDGGVGLIEVGPALRLIYANQGFCQMLGTTQEELRLPCGLKEIGIHPDYEADYEQLIRKSADKEGISDHIHRISRRGSSERASDWIWRHVRIARVAYPGSRYPVMLEMSTDISELIRKERQLRESNERLRVAFRQTPHMMWEVDLENRTYNTFNVDEQCCRQDTVIGDFPWSFIERGIIHPDSAADFSAFADQLMAGKDAGSGNFIIRDRASRCYGWVALSYRMTYDPDGRPVKAVGIQSKLPDLSGIGSAMFPRRALPEILRHTLLIRVKANLTADYVEEIWINGMDQTAWTWGKTYTEVMHFEKNHMFLKSQGMDFEERFRRERLLEDMKKGEVWSSSEYRRVDSGGNIRWMEDMVNLVQEPKTQDVYMFACFCDNQQRHDWERMTGRKPERDPQTGICTAQSLKNMTECLIRNRIEAECALAMIRFVGGPWPGSGEEGEREKKSRRFLATVLATALGMDCIVGEYRPDTLLAFFPAPGSRFDLKKRIEDAFAYIRTCMGDIYGVEMSRFVAGAVVEPVERADYDILVIRAGYLCEMWKNSAMDTVAFPGEEEDWAWAGLRKESSDSGIEVQEDEMERRLTREEQGVAFHCVTDMLTARSLEASMLNALRCIGEYYQAARTYILSLEEDGRTVSMLYEWTNKGRQSIQHILTGVGMEEIPLLGKCLRQEKPVFMECPAAPEDLKRSGAWRFFVFPLQRENTVKGFLCIENAQEHCREAALLGTLIPYIAGERKRFESLAAQTGAGQDALTSLPNLSSYMDVVYSLDSDSYSSMGALSLDVPDFSMLNSNFGFEYGRKFLLYISESLTSVFGRGFIFRTWDAEFVVLFPNTIQEVFIGRCTRLRTMIQRRYPRQVRIGYVWADGIFSARNLVREAQAVMRSENTRVADPAGGMLHVEKKTAAAEISGSHFMPYFQPKIDMRSGALIGAEALARGVDESGNIVLPAQFIDVLEQSGSIRELDLLMLEQVLRQLHDWKEAGMPQVKVSINISRITLFNPTSLASVLAIQSRYPEIPPEQIELEITETAGDMEKATLACIVDNFRECGIGFELDDFGSGYANISVFSNIRFNAIKLDRTIINDLPGNEISNMLVENIVQICNDFGMECVAEGVETPQQAEALLNAGCFCGQGYYYAAPLPACEFEKRYLKQNMNR